MAQAKVPFTFVLISVGPLVLTITMRLVLHPLADVAITAHAFPHAVAVFDTVDPLAVVGVSVHPCVETFATDTTLRIVAEILIPIAEPFVALTVALVFGPVTLVDSTDLIHADTLTVTTALSELTTIERVFVTLDGEVRVLLELFEVK